MAAEIPDVNPMNFVGSGYNVLLDDTASQAVFQMDFAEFNNTKFGMKIPKAFKISSCQKTAMFCEQLEDKQQYVLKRLAQLGVNTPIPSRLFNFEATIGGFTFIEANKTTSRHSYLYEKKLFELEIPCIADPRLCLSESFEEDARELPNTWLPHNAWRFKRFFDIYGHFVVTRAFGGGSMEITFDANSASQKVRVIDEIKADLKMKFDALEGSVKSTGEVDSKSHLYNIRNKLIWNGGNEDLHTTDLKNMTAENWQKWKASLYQEPAILKRDMKLTPISKVVERVNHDIAQACCTALEKLFGEECFPSKSKVWLENVTKPVSMVDLSRGDKVLTWNPDSQMLEYSPVIMFNHVNVNETAEFFQLQNENGTSLHISSGHFIFTFENNLSTWTSKPADHATPGDKMLSLDATTGQVQLTTIRSIQKLTLQGFYAPVTLNGTIIVDDIMASCYGFVSGYGRLSGHSVAHAGMAPMRAAYRLGIRELLEIPGGKDMPKFTSWAKKNLLPFVKL